MYIENNQGIKLSGFFKGIVVKHLSHGKCKVWIPGVYKDEYRTQTDNLPDAEQITPLFGGSNKGNGVFSYPNLDSIVLCGFYNEDQNFPFFFGSILGGDNPKNTQYTDVNTVSTDQAQKSGDDARVHKINVDMTSVKMYESGHIEVVTKGDRTAKPSSYSQIDIDGDGNITIKSTTKLTIDAPDVIINANSLMFNTKTIKVNNASGIEVGTDTLKVDSRSQTEHNAPTHIIKNTETINIISPVVNIDSASASKALGKPGSVAIKSPNHAPFFI